MDWKDWMELIDLLCLSLMRVEVMMRKRRKPPELSRRPMHMYKTIQHQCLYMILLLDRHRS